MNYSQLVQAIQDYTENDEATFVSQIPTFVQQAEQRINRSVMIPDLRKNVAGVLTSGNRFLATPSDFLAVFSLAVIDASNDYHFLLHKDLNFIREAYPATATQGLPVHYSIWDDTSFIVGPTPDIDYNVQLHYYYDPQSIVTASTSWIGDNADTVLLYGSLIEAYTFMKGDPDILTLYTTRYNEALQQLGQLGDGRNKRDNYRDGTPRIEM